MACHDFHDERLSLEVLHVSDSKDLPIRTFIKEIQDFVFSLDNSVSEILLHDLNVVSFDLGVGVAGIIPRVALLGGGRGLEEVFGSSSLVSWRGEFSRSRHL